MTTRRSLAIATALFALFVAPACSSDTDKADADKADTSTTAADAGTTATPPLDENGEPTETTTAPLSPDEWADTLDTLTADLDDAGDDLCKVVQSLGQLTTLTEPTDSTQVKETVGFVSSAFTAISEALPEENSAEAAALAKGAADLESDAEAAGYPADYFTADGGPAPLTSEEFNKAMETVVAPDGPTRNCAPGATGGG